MDQALSSLSNFALTIVVARSVDPSSFGAFAVALTVYTLVVGVARAAIAEPLAVRYSTVHERSERRALAAQVTGAGLVLGSAAGAVVLVAGVLLGGSLAGSLVPLAVGLPFLLTQDMWRFAFTNDRRPAAALVNDGIWVGVEFALIAGLVLAGERRVTLFVLAWGLGAAVAAAVGVGQAGTWPAPRTARAWFRRHRDLWPRFGVEFLAVTGAWQAAIVLVGVLVSVEAVGAFRAAQTVLGPVTVAMLVIPLVVLPELSRAHAARPDALARRCAAIGLVFGAVCAGWGVVCMLIPDAWGTALLGASWPAGRTLIPALTLVFVASSAILGAMAGLRVLGAASVSLRAALVGVPLLLAGVVVGSVRGDATGAAWGMAVANVAAAAVWWGTLVSRIRRDVGAGAQDRRTAGEQ